MLKVDMFDATRAQEAAEVFHRDGFVVVPNALTPEQLQFAQRGANRIMRQQMAETELDKANRGFARYSFGSQIEHPEWRMLIDLPTTLPILDEIWKGQKFYCGGVGGDYSVPGAKIQPLHADMADFLRDPWNLVTFQDLPTPAIVINFLMVDFTEENGAIRFVPCTQRSRAKVPSLEQEPEWMRNSILCAPGGTAVIRDIRCWHGGTANTSDMIRPMTSAGYLPAWLRYNEPTLSREVFDSLSPRSQDLCRIMLVP